MAESLSADAGAGLKALGINCTLKRSPEISNTEALMNRVLEILGEHGVETEILRPVDYEIKFGVSSDEGDGDEWPGILEKIKGADILLMGMSIWFGVRSSVCQMVVERLDGTYNERNEVGQYPLYNKVAGVVVTGNEDGAHASAETTLFNMTHLGCVIPPNGLRPALRSRSSAARERARPHSRDGGSRAEGRPRPCSGRPTPAAPSARDRGPGPSR